jgi:holo-[acyl-carrier protein] synthase
METLVNTAGELTAADLREVERTRVTTGTDLVSVARVDELTRTGGTRFLNRWFSPVEIGYCSSKAFPARHLAARLAAKEAVFKALRTTWQGPVPWRFIEITNDARGAPSVRLSGPVHDLAARTGLRSIEVSMSHTEDYATATVVIVRCGGGQEEAPW